MRVNMGVSFPSSQRCSRMETGTRPKANEDSYRNNTARDTGFVLAKEEISDCFGFLLEPGSIWL